MISFQRYFWLIVAIGVTAACSSCKKKIPLESCTQVPRPADISPDYSGIVIPPNVAPLNFRILETGESFFIRISSSHGSPVEIYSRNANIKIPLRKWKLLLSENKGDKLSFDVFVFDSANGWRRYTPILNDIACEPIDSFLVFRFIRPIYDYWTSMRIYQRNIENYKNSLVLEGRFSEVGCINCHSFCNNSPETMSIATRNKRNGNVSLVVHDNNLIKIPIAWGYTTWHPSGKLAVYSMNKVRQLVHTTGLELRDVFDLDSAISYYRLDEKAPKTITEMSDKDRLETYPTWSPDGKYLYYCSAPILWEDRDKTPPDNFDKVQYDLMRISYDADKDRWGEPEIVLSTIETGMSIVLPRISPDGRFLVFAMCDYSCFPIYRPSSDLYIMDLKTYNYKKLDAVNSPYSESWHSWSSNGRWLAFSSKRAGGFFTRTYFTHINENGQASKPFILPQKDPTYYDSLIQTYSVPELITQPVVFSPRQFSRTACSGSRDAIDMPVTGATPIAPSRPAPLENDRK
jgi:hypothetical protein